MPCSKLLSYSTYLFIRLFLHSFISIKYGDSWCSLYTNLSYRESWYVFPWLGPLVKGVTKRTKTFILAVDFTGEARQQPVRWLPTPHCDSANVWYRIIFSLYASATSAFSRLPLTVILIIFFWILSLPFFPPVHASPVSGWGVSFQRDFSAI